MHPLRDRDEQKDLPDTPALALVRGVWVPGMPLAAVNPGTPATLAARDLCGAFLVDRDEQKDLPDTPVTTSVTTGGLYKDSP